MSSCATTPGSGASCRLRRGAWRAWAPPATAVRRRPRCGVRSASVPRTRSPRSRCTTTTRSPTCRRAGTASTTGARRRSAKSGAAGAAPRRLIAVLRFLTAGESHGKGLVVIVEGLPAGLPVTADDIQGELARRRLGYGRGPRMRFEQDELTLLGGIRHGRTLGSPVAIEIGNSEWVKSDKWHEEMSPAPGATKTPLTQPRPGHADLAGMQKYGFADARDVLERASARETAARVAAGSVAKSLLAELGVQIVSHVVQMGPAVSKSSERPAAADL